MDANKKTIIVGSFLFSVALVGCTLFAPTPVATTDPFVVYTQAAQTIVAKMTEVAGSVTPVSPDGTPVVTILPPTFTSTLQPTTTQSFTPTATPLPPTSTQPPPTATPLPPTATPRPPTATPTPIPCNWAQFVQDITVKDGTQFTAGSVFTKVWLLKNIGTCTWTGKYDLVYVSGKKFGSPKPVSLSKSVKPGQSVEVAIELVAPEKLGKHRGEYQLRDDDGDLFGIGSEAEDPVWVEIKVVEPNEDYAYDFTSNYCVADWNSDADHLPCPGVAGDELGYVIKLDAPVLEGGRVEDEPALWTRPQDTQDGWVRGEYPAFKVEQGHRFKALVGCLNDAEKCKVTFQLRYRIGGGELKTLWEGQEDDDGEYTSVDVDLSSLAGSDVEFVLMVRANGSPQDDEAFWLAPRIVK